MKIVIEIPDSEIPSKQELLRVSLHFIDGHVCECNYPFEELKVEPCDDCISREEVIHCIDNRGCNYYFNLRKQIKELPPVKPEPKQGKWIFVHPLQEDDGGGYMCSICNVGDWNLNGKENYCPNCGAKMQGGDAE